jgi:Universal stress protein UspA and related nucleotide-binding proteins
MPFRKILVAIDGSEYSQIAADYAFWFANELDASVTALHVADPRLVELFIAPEFGEELGFDEAADTEDKIFRAIKKIGTVILDLFKKEAESRGLTVETHLEVGSIVDEVIKRSKDFDLIIVGHRGRGHKRSASHLMTGSVAERIVSESHTPVLVAVEPQADVSQILVAYDGTDASRAVLLSAEKLAMETRKNLAAMPVVPHSKDPNQVVVAVEQVEKSLKEYHDQDIFVTEEGHHAKELIDYANRSDSMVVLSANGHNGDESLGGMATYIVRRTQTSVLVFK